MHRSSRHGSGGLLMRSEEWSGLPGGRAACAAEETAPATSRTLPGAVPISVPAAERPAPASARGHSISLQFWPRASRLLTCSVDHPPRQLQVIREHADPDGTSTDRCCGGTPLHHAITPRTYSSFNAAPLGRSLLLRENPCMFLRGGCLVRISGCATTVFRATGCI